MRTQHPEIDPMPEDLVEWARGDDLVSEEDAPTWKARVSAGALVMAGIAALAFGWTLTVIVGWIVEVVW